MEFKLFLDKQNEFGNKINESFTDAEVHNQHVEDYIEWLESNKVDLEEFKLFIENNYQELKETKKDPVTIRDLIKIILDNNQVEESYFERCNAIYERYNQ